MRKKVFGRHFSRSRKAREALFKSLVSALILHGKIETTFARAKAVQGDIDRIVRLAKKGTVAAFREITSSLSADRELTAKVVKDVASFKERGSGYTRVVRLPKRFGDSAEMARLEWVDKLVTSEKKTVTSKGKEKTIKKLSKIEKSKIKQTEKKSKTKPKQK